MHKGLGLFIATLSIICLIAVGSPYVRGLVVDSVKGFAPRDEQPPAANVIRSKDENSSEQLLALALRSDANVDSRIAAVVELGNRPTFRSGSGLSTLLQPHLPLDLKKAVASALRNVECPAACAESVLHYEERLWRRDPQLGERYIPPADAQGHKLMQSETREILDNLDQVLRRDEKSTLRVLTTIYGLGSAEPSPFSLAFIERTRFEPACVGLELSEKHFPGEEPLKGQIESTIKKIGCKRQLSR